MVHGVFGSTFLALFLLVGVLPASAQVPMRVEVSAQQPDGKILLAGQASNTSGSKRITIGRLNADGTMDSTFVGGAGWLNYDAAPEVTGEFRVTAITTQPDGKILLALVQEGAVALLRLDSYGSPDSSFGYGFPSPGLVLDNQSAGLAINALYIQQGGGIIGLGSYAGAFTSNVRQAALVRYHPFGERDTYFGSGPSGAKISMFAPGDNELRAVVSRGDGLMYAAGYARDSSGGQKNFLFASFMDNGDSNYSFGGWSGRSIVNVSGGYDNEAFALAFDGASGLMASGKFTFNFFFPDESGFAAARVDLTGMPVSTWTSTSRFLYHTRASSSSVAAIPGGGDFLFGGTVVSPYDGRAWFSMQRYDGDNTVPYGTEIRTAPVTDSDDFMVGAYPNGNGQVVAVGTRESPAGDLALRVRYFSDNLDFDTESPGADADAMPNAFSFYPRVADTPALTMTSETVRITGINVPAAISISSGEYAIDCANFTSSPGTIANGQYVCVRLTGAATPSTLTEAALTVGDFTTNFSITTNGVPETTFYSTPPNPSLGDVQFSYSASTPAGYGTNVECRLDGAAFAACPAGSTSYTALPAGQHTFEVRGINAWGPDPTPASYTWTVRTLPDTTITSGPAAITNQPTATFTFVSSDPTATFECRLSYQQFTPCTSPATYAVAFGSYGFFVRALNVLGADPTPASASWVVDLTQPTTTLSSTIFTDQRYGVDTATFSFTSNEAGSTFQCSLDDAPYTPCSSPVTLVGLPDGTRVFKVRAIDPAGNVDSRGASRSWIVAKTPPVTTITAGPTDPSPVASPTFYLTTAAPMNQTSYDCWIDGVQANTCLSMQTFYNLRDGPHVFEARARVMLLDASNNTFWLTGPIVSRSWMVDLPPPNTTLTGWPASLSPSRIANFFFQSDNYGAAFECSLDGAPFTDCPGSASYTALADGAHAFAVRAITQTKIDASPATYAWTVDTTGPTATITSNPPVSTSSASASFAFAANESGATFLCSRDGAAYVACVSPQAYSGLAAGSHYFFVLAGDPAGNYGPSAYWSWTVDQTAPETTMSSAPSGTVAQSSGTLQFYASEAPATLECRFDGAPFASCVSPLPFGPLADGVHTFEARARDATGNVDPTPASATWTVDTSAPDTAISAGPSGTVSQTGATFAFSSEEPGATFQCRLDAGAWEACAGSQSYSNLAEGMHMFEVRAVDALGNADPTPASRTWSIDLTQPNTTIASGPSAVTGSTAATIAFTATEPGTFTCALDGAAFSACVSPVSYAGLAAGAHSFLVYAIDVVGNADASAAGWSWVIDLVAPDTTITAAPSGTVAQASASIAFTSPDTGATFECRLDTAAFAPCTSPASLTGLSSAAHVFQVRATDTAGNVDATPASVSWIVDATAPDTSITAAPAALTNATSATFSFTATESATFECKLDAAAFAACTSAKAYSGLAQGNHTFQVRAKDALGNLDASPASWTWTIDTTAPNTTITSGPSGTVTATTATFTFTATEAGSTFECKLDTAAYAACASPKAYTGLSKANHTFSVRAKDPAGNTDASPATRTWKVN